MRSTRAHTLLISFIAFLTPVAHAADVDSSRKSATTAKPPAATKASDSTQSEKFRLRYKFQQGETVRWEVEQQAQIRTTVAGTTQTAETTTVSTKVWHVNSVDKQGVAVFVHSVEAVDMRHKLTGRQEVRYNSRTDKEVPEGFKDAAKSVGVPLTIVTLDPTGKVVKREEKRTTAANPNPNSLITLPLPPDPVPVGHVWLHPYEQSANAKDGTVKKVKLQQRMTLEEVKNGVATIKVETQVLTPVHDPQIEAQLVQGEMNGKTRFDIDAGRLLSTQTDLDRHVVGFQGESSSLHYLMRFTEKLLPAGGTTASQPAKVAGPVAPQRAAPQPSAPPKPTTPPTTASKPTPQPATGSTTPAKPSTPATSTAPSTTSKPSTPAKPGSRPTMKRR